MNLMTRLLPAHAALAAEIEQAGFQKTPTGPTSPTRPTSPRDRGDWFLTSTGKQFFPLDPRAEDICIEDIAHALSHICRFGGHTRHHYSVAQHSIHVSWYCPDARLQALLHDATEAYIGDMIRPLKYALPEYRAIEGRVWLAICERYNLPVKLHPSIKIADNRALMTERRDLLIHTDHEWSLAHEFPPYPEIIVPWESASIESAFLNRFQTLTQ